jgi:hypothetical protein
MHIARIPPAEPAPAITAAVFVMQTGHICSVKSPFTANYGFRAGKDTCRLCPDALSHREK